MLLEEAELIEPAEFNPFEADDLADARGIELQNSRPLDVHCWSEHPEVNAFVNRLYEELFVAPGNAKIRKKHLKVVLLDLYVTWKEDPLRKVSVARSNNAYRGGGRYNELHVTRTVVEVVDVLAESGLIEQADGFFDRRPNGRGRVSRIWSSPRLTEMFRDARFSRYDIGNRRDREAVILRDRDLEDGRARDVPYDDTDETRRMAGMLSRYNDLLARTFIDIPVLEQPWLPSDADGRLQKLAVSQRDKFVARVFHRRSFDFGGRFYGGWWQRAPKQWRKLIFLNDWPTTEVDFRGLHIMLLYANQGVGYWQERADDPYSVPRPQFLPTQEATRSAVKLLVLMALNSGSSRQAYNAFRDSQPAGAVEKRLTNDQLAELLGAIKDKHPILADAFFADQGVRLMRLDAQVTELILSAFMERNVPVLSLHDSYIVPAGFEDEVIEVMHAAFLKVTGVKLGGHGEEAQQEAQPRVRELWDALMGFGPGNPLEAEAREFALRAQPKRSNRYQNELKEFLAWQDELLKREMRDENMGVVGI